MFAMSQDRIATQVLMQSDGLISGDFKSRWLALIAVFCAVAIFIIDTFVPLGIAVAVLYVVVVLLSGRFLQRRGIIAVGVACIVLTLLSFWLQHAGSYGAPLARCLVSLAAIAITTFLALRIQSAGNVLRAQANLLDITHDAIFVRDMSDIITFWNRGAEKLFGWSREQAIGKKSHELLRTVPKLPLDAINSQLLSADRWEGELCYTRKDGREVLLESRWSVQRDSAMRPCAVLEINNDITERRRIENALRESEANLADAQRVSKMGSFTWNVATGDVRCSEEAHRIFGYEPGIKPTLDLVVARTHPDDRESFVAEIQRIVREKRKNWELDHRVVIDDGPVINIRIVARADETASDLEYIGAFVDVTEAKSAQLALQRAQAQLAHVTRVTTLGELTASIAHEVNQPLAAIVTNAESSLRWLDRDPPELDEGRAALQRIVGNAHRASQVVRRIRDLATDTELARCPLDINDAIRETLTLLESEFLRRQVVLRLNLAKVPLVFADRVQVQQVIINLVMNGIEAMSELHDRIHEISITSRPVDSNGIVVAVQDSGAGIDSEAGEQLFKAFYTTKKGGMGMGLSICRSIIEAHKGELWYVAREDGPGAIFQFSLPASDEATQ
jgi:PAS domain S-box-containing protein